jgi:transitional endoplasmic reticulum ATPase
MQSRSDIVSNSDFLKAVRLVRPSLTKDVEEWYESVKKNMTYAMPKPLDKTFYG